MSALQTLLNQYRQISKTEREKGTYFENLIADFLRKDAVYAPQFSQVWTFTEWAKRHGKDGRDTGIDLIAQNADGSGSYTAIQCKFYAADYTMQKSDIDSLFTAAGKQDFTRCIIVDSTRTQWSVHAEAALDGQSKPTTRIGLTELENSNIDWAAYVASKSNNNASTIIIKPKKQLRPHQIAALAGVQAGLAQANRGKLIMACGTGKTFTALNIALNRAGAGKRVLFLVPSLSLMSQTITEWNIESTIPLHAFAVCSDAQVGIRKRGDDADTNVHDLAYPAMTDAKKIAAQIIAQADTAIHKMTVVFSTYHSIQVVSDAQHQHGLAPFDLIICDEAHRTTGATLAGDDESNFVKIHDADFVLGTKRVYMTATPRIYAEAVKTKAKESSVQIASMDDVATFGEMLYELNFSEAVRLELLCRYKVIVLAVREADVSATLQARQAIDTATGKLNALELDDVTKMIGCYRGLSQIDAALAHIDLDSPKPQPMRRAVAFCKSIASSKLLKDEFVQVINEYRKHPSVTANFADFTCEASHVDGTYNATARNAELTWLKEDSPANTCRILSNARCLTEGVDVPALDAILFLHPRKSQIDVVQAVGRVMRRAEGKTRGYVILPIGVPAGLTAEEVLADNDSYKVVIQVLSALRAHDDEFEATLNKLDLGADVSEHIQIIDTSNVYNLAVIDAIDTLPERKNNSKKGAGIGTGNSNQNDNNENYLANIDNTRMNNRQGEISFDEYQKGIYALLVKKLVKKDNWAYWAADIARIAQKYIKTLTELLVDTANIVEQTQFEAFLKQLRDDLNHSITPAEAIEMLAQHIITKPVFDTLFKDYSFTQNNPVSIAMQAMLDILNKHQLETDADSLKRFYASVKMRVSGINDIKAKQRIIIELYDEFFKNAFPKMTERLGIVYTPVEVVDFIIHSINDVLKQEFNQSLGSKNVHIIDPFTGTGTFITRLLQSGLIAHEELAHKYKHEIHANELVLLAYYIAAINIEQVYHSIMGGEYIPFNGICLADTFALYEKEPAQQDAFKTIPENSGRRKKQKALDIRVIMGNPPYSAGQKSANDNNANLAYENLDEKIRTTYAAHSTATNKNALYDSYIRSIRWASDRIGTSGVIGFVTNAGFIDSNSADGLRKCLAEEFSSIYIFHLRGNQRTSGELSRQEGGKIFGAGSRSPISITILIKNPEAKEHGKIMWHDIGDYLSREEKLAKVSIFKSIAGITSANGWQPITPDKHYDWVGQRDNSFNQFISLGDKKDKAAITVFKNYSMGIKTNRDTWVYNSSKKLLISNMNNMINFYNSEVERYKQNHCERSNNLHQNIENFIDTDNQKISWSRALRSDISKLKKHSFLSSCIFIGLYRPFQKQELYFERCFINDMALMPRIFPNANIKNLAICVSGVGAGVEFSALITNTVVDLGFISPCQCFPLYLYEPVTTNHITQGSFDDTENITAEIMTHGEFIQTDGISDAGLLHFKKAYLDNNKEAQNINKEDVFYYIYGLLHSEDYKKRYADNLSKELPRIPAVKTFTDFMAFSQAGRELANLHINYETVEPYPVEYAGGIIEMATFTNADYYVEKMKFAKAENKHKGKTAADKYDKTSVIYNEKITMTGIPLAAYEYIVNGKPALEWVMERQSVTTHKESGIVNDANCWAIETMGDAQYPLKLFQRIITVSLRTMAIVKGLPRI